MISFNAISEGWLPVRFTDGTVREVGLQEALTRAHEIESLADPRPLGPPTQLRILVALVLRVVEPEDAADWRTLWRRGAFDATAIETYFARWKERFDLFHPETPFLQLGGDFAMTVTNSVAKLAHELDPADYNTLFSHADGPTAAMSPAEALRVLILAQACALGGGVSGNPVWKGKTITRPNFSHAAMATCATVYAEGKNLFQAIVLNLVPNVVENDFPIWERTLDVAYFDGKTTAGPLDRLTNLSRMIRLLPEEGGVRRCCYTQGRAIESAADTMVSYREDKKLGVQSRKISDSRASWRDLHGLLEFSSDSDLRADILRHIGQRVKDGTLSEEPIPLRVAGIAADKAKVLLWRSDRFSVPAPFLEDPRRVVVLADRLGEAGEVETEIGRRVRSMCWHYLAPVKDQMSPDTKDVNALADQLDARQGYWAVLEECYPELLENIGLLPDTEDTTLAPVSDWWRTLCAKAAREALEASQKRLGETPRAWRALAAVSTNFEKGKK